MEPGTRTKRSTSQFGKLALPSKYGLKNLVEALAEYMTAYIEGDYQVSDDFKTHIAPRLLMPNATDLAFTQHYVQGSVYYDSGDYSDAIMEFTSAANLEPETVAPLIFLTYSYRAQGDDLASLGPLNRANSLFEALRIPESEDFRKEFSRRVR